jgi:hypothetical protein
MELFPVLIPISELSHQALVGPRCISVPEPANTGLYPVVPRSYETKIPTHLSSFGPTQPAPLGSIVHACSGDEANNSNVGFFIRNADEYPWLQSLFTVEN